ncbi:MAG: PP2C family protein-serine/threonine phosphatase [Fluviicola sp.]
MLLFTVPSIKKKKNMTSSIEAGLRSAEIVQRALLPKQRHFDKLFSDSFVLYKPKEILSGDFYWIGGKGDYRYIVVGDCSGHGIPAAMVTVLMLNLLEYIIMNKGVTTPDNILNELDKRYIESFSHTQDKIPFDNPWVDLSIICINDRKRNISFSSANRKLLHVNGKGQSTVYKSNGYSLGGWQVKEKRNYTAVQFSFEEFDNLYLGSDGYQDQFGGNQTKKYGSKNLHQLLYDISPQPFVAQYQILLDELQTWSRNEPQTDDICVLGVKL